MKQKFKRTIVAVVCTGVLGLTGIVMASGQSVPELAANVKFQFNDVEKQLPPGYAVLHYNDRIYVPARFIAEELGADVIWESQSQKIIIKKKEDESEDKKDEEKIENEIPKAPEEKTDQEEISNAEKLPISKVTKEGIVVTIKSITNFNGLTSIFLKVTNTSDNPVNLSQADSFFTIDHDKHKGEKYKVVTYEQAWYQNIEEDDNTEGSLSFGYIPKDAKMMNLHLVLNTNHGLDTSTLDFNIDLNNPSE